MAEEEPKPKVSEAQFKEIEEYLKLSTSDSKFLEKSMEEIRRICLEKPKPIIA